MIVTEKILEDGLSRRGGFNLAQLKALLPRWEFHAGDNGWPMKGWRRRIVGADVSKEKIDRFLALKDKHLRPAPKTGNLFEQPKRDRFWPDDLELEPGSPEKAHMQMIGADY